MNGFPVPVRIQLPERRKYKSFANHNLTIGQDNPSTECVVGDVPNVFEGNLNDHDGPYNGITMGC